MFRSKPIKISVLSITVTLHGKEMENQIKRISD